jgi:hypothetical protein
LKIAEDIKGFNPNNLFYNHMVAVGLNPAMINMLIFGEEDGDSHDHLVQGVNKYFSDIETIVSTIEGHKQRERPSNERNVQSHVFSHKSLLPRVNPL